MTNRADLAPADLLESQNDAAERLARALSALQTAVACALTLSLAADELRGRTGTGRTIALELAEQDARATGLALSEADRLLGDADPLGCQDISDAWAELADARGAYREALCDLGLDPLTLAPALLAKAG